LFNAGRHVSETVQDALDAEKASALPPVQENAFPEPEDLPRVSDSAGSQGKEDSLVFPETTSLMADTGSVELVEASTASNTSKKGLFSSLPSIGIEKEVDAIATKKYARILKKNEKVLAAGSVIRHVAGSTAGASGAQSGASKQQRRVLVVTDAPRLLFFDTGAGTVQGALDITGTAPVDLRAVSVLACACQWSFAAVSKGVPQHFACLLRI
jgi:hypothetical protein